MADTVNAVSWSLFMFGGDRSARRDPYRAITTQAAHETGARFDI